MYNYVPSTFSPSSRLDFSFPIFSSSLPPLLPFLVTHLKFLSFPFLPFLLLIMVLPLLVLPFLILLFLLMFLSLLLLLLLHHHLHPL